MCVSNMLHFIHFNDDAILKIKYGSTKLMKRNYVWDHPEKI